MSSNYLWSDAWLFFGVVIYSAKETRALAVSPADIIAAADFIAHDIMSFEQMEGALARLAAGGYLIERNGEFAPSERTMNFYCSLRERPRKPRERLSLRLMLVLLLLILRR
jgi:hypothetical protein